jgi:hypothetical protein
VAAFVKYQTFVEDLLEGVHDFDAHVFKIMLSNASPSVASHAVRADVAEIGAGFGYASGGAASAITTSRSGGTAKVVAADVTFTAVAGSIGPFRYAILYNDTPSAPADPLIAYWDYGAALTLTDGNQFTVDFDGTAGILTLT